MLNWLKEAITDSTTGKVSAKRVVLLQASTALAITIIVLGAAAFVKGMDVSMMITAASVPLCTLAGYSYVNGKANELKAGKDKSDDSISP